MHVVCVYVDTDMSLFFPHGHGHAPYYLLNDKFMNGYYPVKSNHSIWDIIDLLINSIDCCYMEDYYYFICTVDHLMSECYIPSRTSRVARSLLFLKLGNNCVVCYS